MSTAAYKVNRRQSISEPTAIELLYSNAKFARVFGSGSNLRFIDPLRRDCDYSLQDLLTLNEHSEQSRLFICRVDTESNVVEVTTTPCTVQNSALVLIQIVDISAQFYNCFRTMQENF